MPAWAQYTLGIVQGVGSGHWDRTQLHDGALILKGMGRDLQKQEEVTAWVLWKDPVVC